MPIAYKVDILAELKAAGYPTTRLRREKIMGERTIQQIRQNELVSWLNIDRICAMLNCQPGDILEYTPEAPERDAAE